MERKVKLCEPHKRPIQTICFNRNCTEGEQKGCEQCMRAFHEHPTFDKAVTCPLHLKPVDKFCFYRECTCEKNEGCDECMEEFHQHQPIDFCREHKLPSDKLCLSNCEYPIAAGCEQCMNKYHSHTRMLVVEAGEFLGEYGRVVQLNELKEEVRHEKTRFKQLIGRYIEEVRNSFVITLSKAESRLSRLITNFYFNEEEGEFSFLLDLIDSKDLAKVKSKDILQLFKIIEAKKNYNFNLYEVKKLCEHLVVLDRYLLQLNSNYDALIHSALFKEFAYPNTLQPVDRKRLLDFIVAEMEKWKLSSSDVLLTKGKKDDKARALPQTETTRKNDEIEGRIRQKDERAEILSLASSAPDDFSQAYTKAEQLYRNKKLGEALSYYQKAMALNPREPKVYNSIGAIFYFQEKYPDALDYYNKAIELKPNYAHALNNKGNVLTDMNSYAEAIVAYDNALKINQNDAAALNGKGNALAGLKKFDNALECFEKAIQVNPKYPNAYNNKGNTLFSMGKYAQAKQAYEMAVKLDGSQQLFKRNLENVIEKLKQ